MFGIKDVFTSINLLGGVVAICLCIDGQPFEAGVAVVLGYLFGDALDGYVARRLGTANQFGAEFDSISDHTAHVIAPAAIVYTVYKDAGLLAAPWDQVLAIGLAMSMVLSVSIRHARNIVAPVEYKGVWVGLPRTILGFWAIGYACSPTAPKLPGGLWIGVGLIPLFGFLTLTHWPFPSHHLKRRMFGWVIALLAIFIVAVLGSLIFAYEYVFDVVFAICTIYSVFAWTSITREERAEYTQAVASAKARGLA